MDGKMGGWVDKRDKKKDGRNIGRKAKGLAYFKRKIVLFLL